MAISERSLNQSSAGLSASDWRTEGTIASLVAQNSALTFEQAAKRLRLRSSEGWTMDVGTQGTIPDWFQPVIRSLQRLLALPSDWDRYGAHAITPRAAKLALNLLAEALPTGAPVPSLVPMVNGGLQMEWHIEEIDLEVEVSPEGEPVFLFYEDARQDHSWEGELRPESRSVLADAIAALSRRRAEGA